MVFDIVEKCIWLQRCTGREVIVVSGGCPQGADSFAEQACKILGAKIVVFPIDKSKVSNRGDFVREAYERNFQIAKESDYLFCLVSPDRTGGTESTVGYGYFLGKKVFLVDLEGHVYLSSEDEETEKWREERRRRDLRFTDSSSTGTDKKEAC